uniref:Mic1 domain-containing protein n=1 Tax=Mesocestoides corti TaxID=53468 RepID=A0A5K3FEN3_MESCO
MQRKQNSVDFLNFENGRPDNVEYSQACKNSASQLSGFVWSKENEIIFVTNEGFEVYQIYPQDHHICMLKRGTVPTNWYTWDPLNKILLLSSGDLGNRLHVISFEGSVTKLAGFDVKEEDIIPSASQPENKQLQQKNCFLANLYGQLYACILSKTAAGGVELALYKLMKNAPAHKVHALVVPEQGRIAVNFISDLVLVHHQHSRTSLAYDIALKGKETEGGVERHYPILPPISLADVNIPCKDIPALSLEPGADFSTPLYASSWIIFPPNVVIDGRLGCLWTVDLDLHAFAKLISDPVVLVECLLNRSGAKPTLREYCRQLAEDVITAIAHPPTPPLTEFSTLVASSRHLETLTSIFARFVAVQKAARKASKRGKNKPTRTRTQDSPSEPICRPYEQPFVFTPDDVLETILSPLSASENLHIQRFLSHVVLRYISALRSRSLAVDVSSPSSNSDWVSQNARLLLIG